MKMAEEDLKILSTIFLEAFGEYKDTDDFLQLSQTNLKSLLGSDDIGAEELDVFHAAMRWAEFQCRQMGVLPTEERLREVLGDCLFEIRFPLMTCAEFAEAWESKPILTIEESVGIYKFIGWTESKNIERMKSDSKNLQFKTTPRSKLQSLDSRPNSEANIGTGESLIPPGISRLGSTLGFESAKNHPMIRWGNEINGFPCRRKHAAVAVGNAIYTFGGDSYFDPSYYSRGVLDVFVLNVAEVEKEWKLLSVENSEGNPNKRFSHSAVAHKEFVLIFGGWDTKKNKLSNSTYRFNTETLKWDKPKVTGNIPASRWFHGAVVLRNKMLIYGGDGIGTTNDLHCLHLDSFCWSTIVTKGIIPSIREGHSATVINDRFILIFGGYDSEEHKIVNTIYSFDLSNTTWTGVETRGTLPSSRRDHCAFVHNGRMCIFGGYDKNHFNDVFSYDPETLEWKKMTPNGAAPSPRRDAGCVALNDQVFIFGGAGGFLEYLGDTNVLHM